MFSVLAVPAFSVFFFNQFQFYIVYYISLSFSSNQFFIINKMITEDQLCFDMLLMFLSLIFFTFSRITFFVFILMLNILDGVLLRIISSRRKSDFLFAMTAVKGMFISCLLVMHCYLVSNLFIMQNTYFQHYLTNSFIPSKEGKHFMADFIEGKFNFNSSLFNNK